MSDWKSDAPVPVPLCRHGFDLLNTACGSCQQRTEQQIRERRAELVRDIEWLFSEVARLESDIRARDWFAGECTRRIKELETALDMQRQTKNKRIAELEAELEKVRGAG